MANTEHPGGIRQPDYLRELALARLEDLMVQAMPWPKIVTTMIAEGVTESEETCKNWRRLIQKRWAKEDAELRPARKDLWRARLEAQYNALIEKARECKSDFAYAQLQAEATRVAKVAIVLDGLTTPVVDKGDGQTAVAALAPHERERQIAELIAKRDAAIAAARERGN